MPGLAGACTHPVVWVRHHCETHEMPMLFDSLTNDDSTRRRTAPKPRFFFGHQIVKPNGRTFVAVGWHVARWSRSRRRWVQET